MDINYEYYKIFYYVAKHKSITIAARILLNNQPNITRIIKKLEDELGCTLFIRQRHGVALTPEGEKLYKHISLAFDQIQMGEKELVKDKNLQSGTLSIAASEIALHCVLLPILKKYKEEYPNIRIKISNHSTPQAIDSLQKGLVDFAVVTNPFVLPNNIESRAIYTIQEVAVSANSLLETNDNKISYKDLFKYPLIGLEEKTSSYSFYFEHFNKYGLEYNNDIEAATADQILPMVKAGLGIGFVPLEFLKEENSNNISILNLEEAIPTRNICLITRKDVQLSIAAKRLKEMLFDIKKAR